MLHGEVGKRHAALELRFYLRRGVFVSVERLSGEFIHVGYVVVEPVYGCSGIFHEVVGGVLGDPLLVVFEIAISQHVFHNCVPYCCDVLVSLLIESLVFCFDCRSIEWVDECICEQSCHDSHHGFGLTMF